MITYLHPRCNLISEQLRKNQIINVWIDRSFEDEPLKVTHR